MSQEGSKLRPMRLALSFMVAAVVLAAAAGCGGGVVVGEGGSGGGGSGSAGSSQGGSSGTVDPTGMPPPSRAVVLMSPGTAEVHIASGSLSCESPDISTAVCGTWQVTITMPEFLFVPGTVDLASDSVKLFITETGQGVPNDCPGSAASGGSTPGTLTITSVNGASAEIELQGLNNLFLDGKPDGVYTAAVCSI
jgi:hypothetical protein